MILKKGDRNCHPFEVNVKLLLWCGIKIHYSERRQKYRTRTLIRRRILTYSYTARCIIMMMEKWGRICPIGRCALSVLCTRAPCMFKLYLLDIFSRSLKDGSQEHDQSVAETRSSNPRRVARCVTRRCSPVVPHIVHINSAVFPIHVHIRALQAERAAESRGRVTGDFVLHFDRHQNDNTLEISSVRHRDATLTPSVSAF